MSAGKYDFGFAIDWMRKNLSICLAEVDHNSAKLPVTALINQFFLQVLAVHGQPLFKHLAPLFV